MPNQKKGTWLNPVGKQGSQNDRHYDVGRDSQRQKGNKGPSAGRVICRFWTRYPFDRPFSKLFGVPGDLFFHRVGGER